MGKETKRILLFCMILLIYSIIAKSQQQIQLTQNIYNILSYNPGYAGHRDAVNVTGTFRNQFIGFRQTDITTPTTNEDNENKKNKNKESNKIAPSLYMISADLPIKAIRGGIGINILSDQIGAFNNITLNLGYAFQKILTNGGKIGIGLQVKFDNIVLNKNLKPAGDDPLINKMEKNDFMVDANMGFIYSRPNSFFAGISVFNIIETKGKITMYQEKRSFNVHGGYEFRFLTYPTIKFIPYALIKTDLSSYQVDISALIKYKDKYWGGINYRINDGIGLIFGLIWKDFFGSISYDIPMSRMSLGGSWGSFEAVFGYSFKFGINKGKLTQKNTRYL